MRVGILVNPIAGIGGAAGLKGSDGLWHEAMRRGFAPQAGQRAARFVAAVEDVEWTSLPGAMGVPGLPALRLAAKEVGETDAQDTKAGAAALRDAGIDLLCFVGGDGTAADVAQAVGTSVACLGVPAGVKITSPVFAHDPDEAAWLVNHLAPGFETVLRDVTDLDEDAYRAGRLQVDLKGALKVPLSPAVQGGKVPTGETPLEPLVEQALRDWDPEGLHVIGAGSVCMGLKQHFWGDASLLGVDIVHNGRIVAADVDGPTLERRIAGHDGPVTLWISIIGGQGMLLGRGTQVLIPAVLHRIGWDGVRVISPPEKLLGVRALYVDSGDPSFDAAAPQHIRVLVGWNEWRLVRLVHGSPA